MGSMGTLSAIISGGMTWWGNTAPQIACMYVSHGLLDEFGSETAASTARRGMNRLGLKLTLS